VSVSYVKAVYSSALDGTLKPLAVLIAHLVLDDTGARRKQSQARTLYVSVERLARALGVRAATVRQHLRALVRLGVLSVLQPGGGRRRFGRRLAGVATTYQFHPGALPTAEETLSKSVGVARAATLPKNEGVSAPTLPKNGRVPAVNPTVLRRGLIGIEDLLSREKDLASPVGHRVGADAPPDEMTGRLAGVNSTGDDDL
jgi:hypothetical protein